MSSDEPARPRRPVAALALAAFVSGSTAGCYVYRPPPPTAAVPGPGTPVELELSGAGADRMEERTGRDDRTLQGVLLGRENGDLALEVRFDRTSSNVRAEAFRDTLYVPEDAVVETRVKELSVSRTALLVGGGAAVAAILIGTLAGGGSTDGDDGGGPVFLRIPLSR